MRRDNVERIGTCARAVFSADERYRYWWERDVADVPPARRRTVAFVMLNPSTADANTTDPTVRRCCGFAATWGYTRVIVVNLYAYRSTDPRGLRRCDAPTGLDNDLYLERVWNEADMVVVAWGVHGRDRGRAVLTRWARHGDRHPRCLGLTKDGTPRHPLYLPRAAMHTRCPLP